MSCTDEFILANNRRTLLGLKPFEIDIDTTEYLANDAELLFQRLTPHLSKIRPAMAARNCLGITKFVTPLVGSALRCKSYFTLGCLDMEDNPIFSFNESDLLQWAETGVPDFRRVNMHAWVTLSSLEIVDLSIGPTIAAKTKDDRLAGMAITRHVSRTPGFRYLPMILGEDVLPIIGASTTVVI